MTAREEGSLSQSKSDLWFQVGQEQVDRVRAPVAQELEVQELEAQEREAQFRAQCKVPPEGPEDSMDLLQDGFQVSRDSMALLLLGGKVPLLDGKDLTDLTDLLLQDGRALHRVISKDPHLQDGPQVIPHLQDGRDLLQDGLLPLDTILFLPLHTWGLWEWDIRLTDVKTRLLGLPRCPNPGCPRSQSARRPRRPLF